MSKKILYINGSFHTRGKEKVDALYTVDGKIEKLGQACDLIYLREEADQVIDFEGKYIYPDFCGFIEEVEFDCSETGEEMLNVYFKKMAKKAFRKETDKYLEEGDKCETIFPLIAGTPWEVVGLTCDQDGIPADPAKKVEIAKRIIDKADKFGVALKQLHIDPCVMALATMPTAMEDFAYCIEHIHAYAPEVKVTGAISNISFEMPARKYVNMNCMAYAIAAGLDSAIMDPCSQDMMGTIYACEALRMTDKGGRKYNRAYRKGLFGQAKPAVKA